MFASLQAKKLALVTLLVCGVSPTLSYAYPGERYATPGDDLKRDPAYVQYASALIQLDLLANPATASQSITINIAESGMLLVSGTVTTQKIRQYIVSSAKRISGLQVRDELQVSATEKERFAPLDVDALESLTTETITSLYPQVASKVRVTADKDGVVVLNGSIPSYQQKLALSQSIKSQPGCRAVVNLLMVNVDAQTGVVNVSEGGQLALKATRLPSVPPAAIVDLVEREGDKNSKKVSNRSADDSFGGAVRDQQIKEDSITALGSELGMTLNDSELEVSGGTVTMTTELKNQAQVEKAVNTIATAPGVRKIVAKCKPVSIQRNITVNAANNPKAEPAPKEAKKSFFDRFKFHSDEEKPKYERATCEAIRKNLARKCEKRIKDLTVRSGMDRLIIEGEVENVRDRTYVFKQADGVVELRSMEYEFVVRVKEF